MGEDTQYIVHQPIITFLVFRIQICHLFKKVLSSVDQKSKSRRTVLAVFLRLFITRGAFPWRRQQFGASVSDRVTYIRCSEKISSWEEISKKQSELYSRLGSFRFLYEKEKYHQDDLVQLSILKVMHVFLSTDVWSVSVKKTEKHVHLSEMKPSQYWITILQYVLWPLEGSACSCLEMPVFLVSFKGCGRGLLEDGGGFLSQGRKENKPEKDAEREA